MAQQSGSFRMGVLCMKVTLLGDFDDIERIVVDFRKLMSLTESIRDSRGGYPNE